MTQTLDRLLLDSCLDVALLDRLRADPDGELTAAGVPQSLRRLVVAGRGSVISMAAIRSRPLPDADTIVAAVRERAAGDPVFVQQLRANPRHVVGRVLGRALPADAQIEVLDGEPLDLRLSGLTAAGPIAYGDEDAPTTVETEEVVEEVDTEEVVEEEVVEEVEVIVAEARFERYWEPRRAAWRAEHAAMLARAER